MLKNLNVEKVSSNGMHVCYYRCKISKAIPTSVVGAKQRARECYYSSYTLSSEREKDEQFQVMINNGQELCEQQVTEIK